MCDSIVAKIEDMSEYVRILRDMSSLHNYFTESKLKIMIDICEQISKDNHNIKQELETYRSTAVHKK